MSTFGPNVETTSLHVLARHGLSLQEARHLTDKQLLALHGLGRQSLAWIRLQNKGRRCPTCGRPYLEEQTTA